MPNLVPRVALFTDSYGEANGVARVSRSLAATAERHRFPLLCVYGGSTSGLTRLGTVQQLSLRRSRAAFRLEHDLSFDPLLWRHYATVKRALCAFRPDVIHITGPSDVGQLGAALGHKHHIPMVGSWHTNLHQYAALRSAKWLRRLPPKLRGRLAGAIERGALSATLLFYRIPRALMAPNAELVKWLTECTGKRVHLMKHGVDMDEFCASGGPVRERLRIGFVGRLSAEKNVRLLADLADALRAADIAFEFVVAGDGTERAWLHRAIPEASFHGVLRGADLTRFYASLDLFAFPSKSETFGLAVLEAMASGVAVLAMAEGGPRFVIEDGVSGWLAKDDRDFIVGGVRLSVDCALREQLGTAAQAAASECSWLKVWEDLHLIYASSVTREDAAPDA